MKYLIALSAFILFSACNQESIEKTKKLNATNPYLAPKAGQNLQKNSSKPIKNEKVAIEKLKIQNKQNLATLTAKHQEELATLTAKHQEELAKIAAQKETKLKELELKKTQELTKAKLKTTQIEANKSIAIAALKKDALIAKTKEESSFKKSAIIIAAVLFVIFLFFYYFNKFSKRAHETRLKEQELQQQAYMEEMRLKQQNVAKMLEIISDEKSDKEIKKEMTKLLSYNKENLLEQKKL